MRRFSKLTLGLALLSGSASAYAQAPSMESTPTPASIISAPVRVQSSPTVVPGRTILQVQDIGQPPSAATGGSAIAEPNLPSRAELFSAEQGAGQEPTLGPTPLPSVNILNDLLGTTDSKCFRISGWLDADYTYRSTGPGVNNIAPVMNRFGDEALLRQFGLYAYKPLDEKELSWGFNAIFIAGADASFLGPTAGGWANTNPRFGSQFTDLNLTAHLPVLTEGGVDIKAGRQTTVLGPQGALPWQRFFDSSDYAWYNLEEGRYTGVSATWHISKRLDWYNGAEIGGWGVFFDMPQRGVDYITQISYWLDEEAKNTKVWATVLTGPTGFFQNNGNSTTLELGLQHNWSSSVYQIIDTQMTWSKAPIFFHAGPGYEERAYDVYTYLGKHLSPTLDLNTRLEWYYDQDGGGYPGGFGIPNTNYYESTVGFDYHPEKWLQIRPEIRYDYASNPAFGRRQSLQNQLSLACDILLKF